MSVAADRHCQTGGADSRRHPRRPGSPRDRQDRQDPQDPQDPQHPQDHEGGRRTRDAGRRRRDADHADPQGRPVQHHVASLRPR